MSEVTIVDYGIGNVLSVARAFEHAGAMVRFAQTPEHISKAERLVVPGVGAFGDCVGALTQSGFMDAAVAFAQSGKPYLGICVGMQMMLQSSDEFGAHDGLGLIDGTVTKITTDDPMHKIPSIGWKKLNISNSHPLFAGIAPQARVYFLHSYKAVPKNDGDILASYDYAGATIPAAIGRDNMIGTQFHPEKSGEVGLRIIENFLAL